MDCTILVAKTKALISFAVTAKLICVFVFAYAKSRFSHNEAHIHQAMHDVLMVWACIGIILAALYEPHYEETCSLHMQK